MQCAYIAFFASLEMYTLADYTSEFWLYHYEWLFLFEFLFCLFCSFSNVFLFFFFFFLMIRPPPSSPLFPSTTLSRSGCFDASALPTAGAKTYNTTATAASWSYTDRIARYRFDPGKACAQNRR